MFQKGSRGKRFGLLWGAGVLVVVALLVVVLWRGSKDLWNRDEAASTFQFFATTGTAIVLTATWEPSPTLTITPTLTATPLPSSTPTPTATPSPTPTVTPSATPVLRSLEVPLGPSGEFVLHRLQSGDNWTVLTTQYGTSKAAVVAVNALPLDRMFWEGLVVVIPVGVKDPTVLKVPPLEAYQVPQDIRVWQLAQNLKIDLALFQKLNLCAKDDILHAGDWVLVPRNSPGG